MEEVHMRAIQSNFTSLVETTDLDAMVSALFEIGVFTEAMIEPYRDTTVSQRDRKRSLYLDIQRRGPQAFGRLLDVLKELGNWDLVRDLDPNSTLHIRPRLHNHDMPKPTPKPNEKEPYISIGDERDKLMKIESEPPMGVPAEEVEPALTPDNNNGETVQAPFVVKKSTKFIQDNEGKVRGLAPYRTRGKQRGILLLFSYVAFKHNIEKYRAGVNVDCDNLKRLFSEMGFKPLSYTNLSKEETESALRNLSTVVAGFEMVFVVVSSHGHELAHSSDVEVRCSDGKLLPLRTLISYFSNRRLPQMQGVPKVFVMQMCRGKETEYTWVDSAELDNSAATAELDGTPEPAKLDSMLAELDGTPVPPGPGAQPQAGPDGDVSPFSDILIAQSTLPGFVSHRDPALGSWYIQALCSVFAQHAHDTDVDQLFKLVDQNLGDVFRRQTSCVTTWRFNRRLYLHPGLYE